MIIGFLIIIIFPFIYFYTQANNFGKKTSAIKKAMDEGRETYIDTVDMCERWLATGEKVYHCKWVYTTIKTEDAIEGDNVLMGLDTHRVYRNYSKESFIKHVQSQIDNGECWCWERHAYNEKAPKDYYLHYNMKEKYFYRLRWDSDTHDYCIEYDNTDKKDIITYERYKELGGTDWKDKTKDYRR